MRLFPLFLGLVLTGCSCAKKDRSEFGEPLFVNGRRVTDDEIKLALIYGPCRPKLDLSKVDLAIEIELLRQSEGKSDGEIAALRERHQVGDAEFEAEYKYQLDDFKKTFPTLDIDAEVCRAFRTVDSYREQLRQTMRFDSVFLPNNPADWPPTTTAAIRSDKSGGELMIPDAFESYRNRTQAAAINHTDVPREDPLLMTFLREMVRNAMFERTTFMTHPELKDPKLAFWVDSNADGKPEIALTIDELWNKVRNTVTENEIAEAKQWYLTSLAVHDQLGKDHALLSDAEARATLDKLSSDSRENGSTLEQDATRTWFFPSVEAFAEYSVMREGYRRMIAPKMEPAADGSLSPALREHFDRANRVMGLGMIDCEVLLVSAMDIGHFRWKKDGWTEAHKKAQRLREEYDRARSPETWTRLMNEHCDYWDPPPPESHDGKVQKQSDIGYKKKGRFGPRYRNDLIAYVGETPYNEWVTGECITDHMFFDQAEGTVDGPFRGPLGWYLTRVIKRTPPSRPLNLEDPHHMQLLRDDYLRWSFDEYTKHAVARAKILGWKPQ